MPTNISPLKICLLDSEAGPGKLHPEIDAKSLEPLGLCHFQTGGQISNVSPGKYVAAVIHQKDDEDTQVAERMLQAQIPVIVISGHPGLARDVAERLRTRYPEACIRSGDAHKIAGPIAKCLQENSLVPLLADPLDCTFALLTALFEIQLEWETTGKKPFETIGSWSASRGQTIGTLTDRLVETEITTGTQISDLRYPGTLLARFQDTPNVVAFQQEIEWLRDNLMAVLETAEPR